MVVTEPGDRIEELRGALGSRFSSGDEAAISLATTPGTTVVNGIVGAAGLRASMATLDAGNRLALANKESLVTAGSLLTEARDRGTGELIPVDSEHSAIYQCLVGEDPSSVQRLVLTASGGPFHGSEIADLVDVTVDQALQHPTWSMGPRITIDSATLMNKAFEVIEAHHLFGVSYDNIEVIVHRQSFAHSFVEFTDGVVKAELGHPDMRKPIQYAITAPTRLDAGTPSQQLTGLELTFAAPDRATFPALDLGYRAGKAGGNAPAVLNAADEVAVAAFLDRKIRFPQITAVVEQALDDVAWSEPTSIEDVSAEDAAGRRAAEDAVGRLASAR